ncbi:amidohydrolase family protein [Pirellulaceae bacterium SH501]
MKIKKGDTLYDIGLAHGIDWKVIWNSPENVSNNELGTKKDANGKLILGPNGRPLRKPEWIDVGQELFIPEFKEIKKSGIKPNETAVCTIRDPMPLGTETPRFDCHCHAHARSIYRMWAIGCITPSEAQKALVCNAEMDNFQMVSNPGGRHGRVAAVPLLMDMAYGPLWNSPNLDSTINADMIALFSSSVGRIAKSADEPTDWDPWNIYPIGSYFVCEDDFTRWRDAIVAVHRANPGYCFPFVPFDPRRPDALARVKDCIVNFGFVGIKLYTRQGWRLTGNAELVGDTQTGKELDDRVIEMLVWAEQNDVPVLNHCSPGGWPKDEHIAFPKGRCFKGVNIAEKVLRDFEQEWYHAEFQKCMRGLAEPHEYPRPIDASGRMRLGVIAYLKHQQPTTHDSFKTLAKNSLENERTRLVPRFMTQAQFTNWVNHSANYANEFVGALAKYKQLTVAPDPELKTRYPQLRFCLAHAGSESILKSELPATATQSIEFCYQHPTDGWLDQGTIEKWLACDQNSYVDISNFTEIQDYSQRVEMLVKLLKWFKSIGKTNQVLFGTDWPLTWLNDANGRETWDTVRNAAEQVAEWQSCWDDITRNNPMVFLGLVDKSKAIDRLYSFHGNQLLANTWLRRFACPPNQPSRAAINKKISTFQVLPQQKMVVFASDAVGISFELSEANQETTLAKYPLLANSDKAAVCKISGDKSRFVTILELESNESNTSGMFCTLVASNLGDSNGDATNATSEIELLSDRQHLFLNIFGVNPTLLGPAQLELIAFILTQLESTSRSSSSSSPSGGIEQAVLFEKTIHQSTRATTNTSYRLTTRLGVLRLEQVNDRKTKAVKLRFHLDASAGFRVAAERTLTSEFILSDCHSQCFCPVDDYLESSYATEPDVDLDSDDLFLEASSGVVNQSQEGLASVFTGAIAGDLSENDSWSAMAGQVGIGFVPILGQLADARDIIAASKNVLSGADGSWMQLGIATIAIVPGLDFLKSGRKAGRKILRSASETATSGSKTKGALKRLSSRMSKEGLAKAKALLKKLNVGRTELVLRTDDLLSDSKLTTALLEKTGRETKLKSGLPAALLSTRNTFRDKFSPNDFAGALRDNFGIPVRKGTDGSIFNHQQDVRNGIDNLRSTAETIKKWLGTTKDRSSYEFKKLSEYAESLTEYSRTVEEFLKCK